VERKLAKRPAREHESLRATYERMLERGPERFQVKPAASRKWRRSTSQLPNFADALDDIAGALALSRTPRRHRDHAHAAAGPAGIGKTHFGAPARDLLGTGMTRAHELHDRPAGCSPARPRSGRAPSRARCSRALVDGQYANPVIVVDEIDKASADAQYDPLGPLYSLLEHDTRAAFMDEFAEVAIDASQVIWIMTANDERCIPEPILNRMNVFEIERPRSTGARRSRATCTAHPRRARLGQALRRRAGRRRAGLLAELAPREMRRALMTGFGNARLAQRGAISRTTCRRRRRKGRWASCSSASARPRRALSEGFVGSGAGCGAARRGSPSSCSAANTASGYCGWPRLPL
jgi:ATP-dependent Lon protease